MLIFVSTIAGVRTGDHIQPCSLNVCIQDAVIKPQMTLQQTCGVRTTTKISISSLLRIEGVDCGDEAAGWLDSVLGCQGFRLLQQTERIEKKKGGCHVLRCRFLVRTVYPNRQQYPE